jgi:hypothetical protein
MRAKRLTRDQKQLISKLGYDPKAYLLLCDLDAYLLLKEKKSDVRVLVDKPVGKKR